MVALAIFGLLIVIVLDFLTGSQRVSTQQRSRTTALSDVRSAASRVAETLSQAAYVYPQGSLIRAKVNGQERNITTGAGAVALLEYDEGSPCTVSDTCRYIGVLLFVDDRSRYADQVPANTTLTQAVLVQGRTRAGLTWPQNSLPTLDWRTDPALAVDAGVQAESVVSADTSLMATGTGFASYAVTDAKAFNGGIQRPGFTPLITQADALINRVSFRLAIQPAGAGMVPVQLEGSALARNIPRSN